METNTTQQLNFRPIKPTYDLSVQVGDKHSID